MPRGKKHQNLDPHSAAQLEHTLKSLARSGASKFFYHIRRRAPGRFQFPYWRRNIPVEEVDDLREYCYGEGGDQYEYKIEIRDGNGVPVNGPDGQEIPDCMIPAGREPEKTQLPAPDPILEARRKELESRRQEVELMRQEAELERQKKRVEALRRGEDPDEIEDDGAYPYGYPPPYGYYPPYGYHPPGMGYVPPWAQQQNQSKREDTLLLALIEAIKDRRPEPPKENFFDVLIRAKAAGLLGDQVSFKDLAGVVSPFMAEVGKISAEGNKLLMQNLAESDRAFRERVLDLVMASGAGDDDIERWRKILGLVTETAQQGIKLVLGRNSVVKGAGGGSSVNVPIVRKPTPPGLPGPQKEAVSKELPESAPEKSEVEEAQSSPQEAAKRVIRERVKLFLVAHEQEMLVGSDPAWAADKLDEVWASLPDPLRVKLEGLEVGRIYEELRSIAPEIVERVLKAIADDETETLRKWCIAFWDAIKAPISEEEGEEPEGEPEEESEEVPEEESEEEPGDGRGRSSASP